MMMSVLVEGLFLPNPAVTKSITRVLSVCGDTLKYSTLEGQDICTVWLTIIILQQLTKTLTFDFPNWTCMIYTVFETADIANSVLVYIIKVVQSMHFTLDGACHYMQGGAGHKNQGPEFEYQLDLDPLRHITAE